MLAGWCNPGVNASFGVLQSQGPRYHAAMAWPELSLREHSRDRRPSPFDITIEPRKLRLVLDNELVPDGEGKLEYLRELLQLDEYEVYTQLQPGEANDGTRFRIDLPERPKRDAGMAYDFAAAIIEGPGGRSMHSIGAAWNNMDAARNKASNAGVDREAAANADLLAGASAAIGADVLVTERESLLTFTPRHRANPVSVGEALAVVGLRMRSTGRTTLRYVKGHSLSLDLGTSDLVQSWTLLPDVRDAVSHAPPDQRWPQLLREAAYRVGRMLRARDHILLSALTFSNDRNIDVQGEVETLALSAMAAFDIVARAANSAIPLNLDSQQCGFRNTQFRKALRKAVPAAGKAMRDAPVTATFDLVAGIRNTIHAEPLLPAFYQGSGMFREEARVLLPEDVAGQVCKASKTLGKTDYWLKDVVFHDVLVHPQHIADDLVTIVADCVNKLVSAIRWPREPRSRGWENSRNDDPMASENAQRMAWLYKCT
jgi:hypothetical protein